MRKIGILWDDSHIWGLMALRAIDALGFVPRLLKAGYIARNGLYGNGDAALVVPGGRARAKAAALGELGLANIRSFVAGGGVYIGFCGGAGLALAPREGEIGIGLCPWQRGQYPRRLLHLISGDLLTSIHLESGGILAPLPVWWPGRFAPVPGAAVRTLAQSLNVGEDFWLADIRAAHVPPRVLRMWCEAQGLGLDYLAGQPLVIDGKYGKGRYILSYAHLETPQSAFANAWLAALLGEACEREARTSLVPAWAPAPEGARGNSRPCDGAIPEMASKTLARMEKLFRLGIELRLFFQRSSWLFGWRAGFAGLGCNSLRLGLAHLAQSRTANAAAIFWEAQQENFSRAAEEFFERAEGALWNLRLENTLEAKPGSLAGDTREIFGHPMLGGGLIGSLLDVVYELIYLNQTNR